MRAPVLVAVVLIGAAGCSSGSSGPSAPTSATTASTPAPSTPAAVPPTASPSPSPSTSAAPSRSAAAAGPTRCDTSQLVLTVEPAGGGAGNFHQVLRLTNRGDAPCTLTGYPGVSFLDGSGHQIGQPAQRTGQPYSPVTIAPGRTAHALLDYANAQAYPEQACRPEQSATVRVYPPGQTVPLQQSDSILVCSAGDQQQLHIEPVQPGPGPTGPSAH